MVIYSTSNSLAGGAPLRTLIVGAGEPVTELIRLIQEEPSLELAGIMDPQADLKETELADVPVVGWLKDMPDTVEAAIIGCPAQPHGFDREAIYYLLLQKGLQFPALVAKSARLDNASLRRGCVALDGAMVATDAMLGENCLLGVRTQIEPGATVPDHAYVGAESVVDTESVARREIIRHSFKAAVARSEESLNAILHRISWANTEIILVVDEDGRLIGTVTDGDIRRGILSGVSLEEPVVIVMNPAPVSVSESVPQEEMLQLMRQHSIRHLPVLDDDGCPVRLERMEQLVDDITGQAVVMAGGLGTRLRPFTDEVPKPLVPVAGRPILDHTLSRLRRSGIENVVISLNYRGDQIRRHIGTGRRRDLKVDYVSETRRLGTAGALKLLDPVPSKPFLVMNGDLMTNMNFSRLLQFQGEYDYEMVLCVRQHRMQIPYGVVDVENGCVQGLREKPHVDSLINAGIYVIKPDCIDLIPEDTFFDMTDLVDAVQQRGGKVGAFPIIEYWRDIGRPEDLAAAHEEHEERFVNMSDTTSIPMEIIS